MFYFLSETDIIIYFFTIQQRFRLVHIESTYRSQNKCEWKIKVWFGKGRVEKGRVENIVGKGENAGYQHFLLFPQCFHKDSFPGLLKVVIVL